MSDKIEISKVVFKIGDKTIDLTLDEAKKLQGLLNSNFGQLVTTFPFCNPIPVPYYPEPYRWGEWEITRQTQTSGEVSPGTLMCSC